MCEHEDRLKEIKMQIARISCTAAHGWNRCSEDESCPSCYLKEMVGIAAFHEYCKQCEDLRSRSTMRPIIIGGEEFCECCRDKVSRGYVNYCADGGAMTLPAFLGDRYDKPEEFYEYVG